MLKEIAAGAILLSVCSSALAETVQYGYDAQGRLLVTDIRRSNGTGYAAGYGYDKAGNRSVYQNARVVKTGGLASGTGIGAGESILSPGGAYRFILQYDGNLVLYAGPLQPIWSTSTFQPANARLEMQGDGNLVLYSGSTAIWASHTDGHPGAYFAVQEDGNIVVYTAANQAIWARFGL